MITIYNVETGETKEVTQKEFEILNTLDVVFAQQTSDGGVRWCFDSLQLVERLLADMGNAGED